MRKGLLGIIIVFGLGVAALTLLAALVFAALSLAGDADALLAVAVMVFSLLAVGVGLGIALAWTAWGSLQGRSSPRLRLPASWLLLLLFGLLLVLGEAVRNSAAAVLLLPPLHAVVSLLPPLILIAAVVNPLQRAGAVFSRRDLTLQLGFGALVATLAAIAVETLAILGAFTVGVTLAALLPGGMESLQTLNELMQSPDVLGDPQQIIDRLVNPPIILAAGLLLALLGPAIEEFAKSLGVLLSGLARGRLSRARAFALGAMAGAGFSLVEALFNGATLLPDQWASAVMLRATTVVIHGVATGLMGLGWYALLIDRSRLRFLGYAAAAILLHGVWNGLSGLLTLAGVTFIGEDMQNIANAGLALVAAGLLIALFIATLAALAWLTRSLAAETRRDQTAVLPTAAAGKPT